MDKNINEQLLEAAMKGDTYLCEYLIDKKGADINTTNDFKQTPLHNCYGNGHLKTAAFLILKGANKELKNVFGLKPEEVSIGI